VSHQGTDLRILLENRDHVLPELLPGQKKSNHHGIFVAVADEQRAVVFEVWKSGDKLRLGTTLEAEAIWTSCFEDFLHDFVKLIHLDRVHADVSVLITRFLDGLLERVVKFRDARSKKILKANEQWEFDALGLQILNNLVEIDADRVADDGTNAQITFVVNGEIVVAPQLHPVQVLRIFGRPDRIFNLGHRNALA
jgi:hypothetical protein